MMEVTILCVGKLKENYLTDACSEYLKRLQAFCKPRVVEVSEFRLPDNPSPAQIESCVEKEGEALMQKIPQNAMVIPLCIEGDTLSSEELSETIAFAGVRGSSALIFIIGGSHGLSGKVKALGRLKLSMSRMTFPHQLARVMLLEQLYRSFSIASGGKYHK